MANDEKNLAQTMEQQFAELMESQQEWIRGQQEMQRQQQETLEHLGSTVEKLEQAIKQIRLPEIEFPKFKGHNPRQWVRKCGCYFALNRMSDRERILVAAMHMEGAAENWYAGNVEGRKKEMAWDDFAEMVVRRFEDWKGVNILQRFTDLKQVGRVEEYICEFEELQALMAASFKQLAEPHFVYRFVNGLADDIRTTVALFSPKTLISAMHLAINHQYTFNPSK